MDLLVGLPKYSEHMVAEHDGIQTYWGARKLNITGN